MIDGGPGDDSLVAGAGDDYVDGEDGNDAIDGGPGRDWVTYHYAPAAVRVDLTRGVASGWGSDTLTGVEDLAGSRFGDRLVGDGHANHFEGGRGVDVISGIGGADILLGEGGATSSPAARGLTG